MKDDIVKSTEAYRVEELKVIHSFRYLSWFLTSTYYYFTDSISHWIFKLSVIALLYFSSKISISAYNRFGNNTKFEKSFIYAEILGITLLLLPTGGLKSPFFWYALNPMLISAIFSSYFLCWIHLACYLSLSSVATYLFFNTSHKGFFDVIASNSYLILIFILITLVTRLLAKLVNEHKKRNNQLLEANIQLSQANNRIHESMDHIMSLYQTVEALTSQDSVEDMYQTFADYTAKLTRADCAFFWYKPNDTDSGKIFISGSIPKDIEDKLVYFIKDSWDESMFLDEIIKIGIENYKFNAAIVRSAFRNYGLIGFRVINCESDVIKKEYMDQLKFISNLSAIVLERFDLEEVTGRLMISEEQNRIANEMHDSVAQRLFSISCAVHTIMENWSKMNESELRDKLLTLQDSSHSAMKELRSTIYRLSSRKGGQKCFQTDIRDYLNNIARLNSIKVNFSISGDEELISISKKRGLYRIICEATGNAVRHGKCSSIRVNLEIEDEFIKLSISDDGEGFVINDIYNKQSTGLGLQNMKRLVDIFDGEIDIDSKLGSGTTINITLPNRRKEKKKGA